MVTAAEDLLVGTGWLPDPLRTPPLPDTDAPEIELIDEADTGGEEAPEDDPDSGEAQTAADGSELGNECEIIEAAPGAGALTITDLNHVTCFITDTRRTVELYQALFGFPIDTFQGTSPVMRVGSGVQQFIPIGGFKWPEGPMVDHACFIVEDFGIDRLASVLSNFGMEHMGENMRVKEPNQSYWTRRLPDRGGGPRHGGVLFHRSA